MKLWTEFSRFDQNQSEHRKLARLVVDRELEAFGEKRLQHLRDLVLRVAVGQLGAGADVEVDLAKDSFMRATS